MEVSGVRSSCETLAMKSRRVFSTRSVSVRSRKTATAPPPGRGAAVTSKLRPGTMEPARAEAIFFPSVIAHGGQQLGVAHGFYDWSIQPRALCHQALHAPIAPLHSTVRAHGPDGILHGVKKCVEL